MGMFDSVNVFCPACGAEVEFQSKAGECCLLEYSLDNMPASVAADLNGESCVCDCGKTITLITQCVVSVTDT